MLQQRLGVKVQGTKSARLSGPSSRRRGAPRTLRGRSCVGTVRLPLSLPLAMGRRRYLRDDDDDDRRFSRRPDSARSPPLPRPRSSPLFEPPRLDVRATLSAEAATRLMLEKWDLMDDLAERAASRTSSRSSSARSRQPKGRPSSLPPFEHERRRRISRVEEYERWKPERERIRLAQVEMERRLDEEKLEAQLVRHDERSVSVMSRPRSARSKVRERKATPAVLGTAISSEEEEEDVARRRRGRLSAVSSTASRGSPVSNWRESQDPVGKQQSRQETKDERRSRRSRKERPRTSFRFFRALSSHLVCVAQRPMNRLRRRLALARLAVDDQSEPPLFPFPVSSPPLPLRRHSLLFRRLLRRTLRAPLARSEMAQVARALARLAVDLVQPVLLLLLLPP